MRLSEWRSRAPHKEAMTPRVVAVVESVLAALGGEDDPSCWVIWGDDPGVRYVLLAPTDAGLLQVLVRVNVPGEGPRASAKVIRWPRVQLGELALEMVSGHRLLGFQVESHVLRGSDDEGDDMASFALELFARVDGRPVTPRQVKRSRAKPAGAAPRLPRRAPVRGARPSRPWRNRSAPQSPPHDREPASPRPSPARHRLDARATEPRTRCPPRPAPGARSTRSDGRCATGSRASWPARSRAPGCGSSARDSSACPAARPSIASITCRGRTRSS